MVQLSQSASTTQVIDLSNGAIITAIFMFSSVLMGAFKMKSERYRLSQWLSLSSELPAILTIMGLTQISMVLIWHRGIPMNTPLGIILIAGSLLLAGATSALFFVGGIAPRRKPKGYASLIMQTIFESPIHCIVGIDQDGKIVEFNHAAEQVFGYRRAEVIGRDLIEYTVPQRQRQQLYSELKKYLETGESNRLNRLTEINAMHATGYEFPIELGMVEGESERGKRILTLTFHSIVDRKRTEGQLRKLYQAIEHCPATVVITDSVGCIEYVNPKFTQLTGYERVEVLGKDVRILNSGKMAPEFHKDLWKTLLSGQEWRGEILNRKQNGELFWESASISPISNDAGKITHFVSVKEDITQRKQDEEDLSRLHGELVDTCRQAGMAEVATGVLHNVGNVLNSVNVSATFVTEKLENSCVSSLVKASDVISEHQEDLAAFLTTDERGKSFPRFLKELATNLSQQRDMQLEELRSLVKNIEHVKEIVSMQQVYAKPLGNMQAVDLVTLAKDALKLNDTTMMRHNVDVACEFNDIPPIVTDKHQVLQILVNLISNAKAALCETDRTDKETILRITTDETRVYVSVQDNGVGIPKENLSKVFANGFTTKKDGHGFGLHTSALAAQKLGGSLSVQSDGPGQGATFTLQLPFQRESLCKV
ncbi:Sensor histidine kinase TmoS [Novipirellula aureliae]|uniref:histidine kinase n=1 Tax=Novipirellula aureliae TaxID=2527966 RepID=A0A5C6DYC5_9BACT|nr:PAS domain-containing sensor histidine kinase [Novipirellula aureliae]TWU41224.1 Sensor histidine kinase TmoS [Novipirellula aureliae]